MNWLEISLWLNGALAIVLIVRLLRMRLAGVYSVFCTFLFLSVIGSSIYMLAVRSSLKLDYRLAWFLFQIPVWPLTLWMVYSLLGAVLKTMPGILSFSRRLLNAIFLATIVVSLFAEAARLRAASQGATSQFGAADQFGVVFDEVISIVALFALLLTLAFVLYFPVQMPRNLAVFSISFVVYFAARTVILMIYNSGAAKEKLFWSLLDAWILSAAFIFWNISINQAGEAIPTRVGHSWRPEEQHRLLQQLDAMNASLLRSAKRS